MSDVSGGSISPSRSAGDCLKITVASVRLVRQIEYGDRALTSQTRTPTAKPDGSPDAGSPRRQAGFPAPITILTLVLVLSLLTFFIPSGQYQLDASGSPIPGSFIQPIRHWISSHASGTAAGAGERVYGIQDPGDRRVAPFNHGTTFGERRCSCSSSQSVNFR